MSSNNSAAASPIVQLWRGLGPGILFAATGIGVSHLVQSTRAGADFGLGLLLAIILVNAAKYPAFRFSTHYVSATGQSLLTGYRSISPAAPWIFAIAVTPIYFIGVAALSIVTAGLAISIFNLAISASLLAILIIIGGAVFLVSGHYHWLEVINKWMVAFLAAATVITAIMVLPQVPWSVYPETAPALTAATLVFIVGLIGYMPSPMEVSTLHSLWSVAKGRYDSQERAKAYGLIDFNIGYIGTAILAVCFLIMGAGIMHSAGVSPEPQAVAFADQLIGLYSQTLGPVAGILAGAAALMTMLSSFLTVFDGGPRSVVAAIRGGIGQHPVPDDKPLDKTPGFYAGLILTAIVAIVIVTFLTASIAAFLDFGAGLAFTIGPIIALLNHLAVFGKDVAPGERPARFLWIWSWIGIILMAGIAVAYWWISLT